MGRIVYKSDYFKCTFSTVKKFNEQLQEMLDRYSSEGWLLHSYQVPGEMAGFCTLVFYREERD